jgi:hypothetical protein
MLTKEQFLASRKRTVEAVNLPDGDVYVRTLTVAEQMQFEAEAGTLDESDTQGYTAIAVAFWMCTDTGEPFLTLEESRKHVGALSAPEVAAIMKAGAALNRGLSAKAVETAAGN